MARLGLSLILSSAFGFVYTYLYYGIPVRGKIVVPIVAAIFLVVLPATAAWVDSRQKWLDVPLSVAVAWATAFWAAVVVWKDGL